MIRTDVEINEAPFETYGRMRYRTLLERQERRAHRQISPADEREPLERPHKPRCCKPMYGGVRGMLSPFRSRL